MATVYHRRTTKEEHDWTIFDIPRDKRFVEMVQEYAKGSKVRTDEHTGYKKPGEVGCDHAMVNHTEGEYTSGPNDTLKQL